MTKFDMSQIACGGGVIENFKTKSQNMLFLKASLWNLVKWLVVI